MHPPKDELLTSLTSTHLSSMWSVCYLQGGHLFWHTSLYHLHHQLQIGRAWPPAAANSAFSQLLSDIISGTDSILVATDGSFDPATNRAGWGFAIFSNGEQEGAGAHQVFTSSTRMELEAIRNALKAIKDMKAPPTIIVATDSMAILCKIQSGYLPGEWFDLRDAHSTIKVI